MADPTKDQKEQQGPPNIGRSVTRVKVLVDNLGPDLLKQGTVTEDPRVVALLKTQRGRKLVEAVR